MLTLGLAFVASIVSILALSAIMLCRSEISLQRRSAKGTIAWHKLQRKRRSYAKERMEERTRFDKNMSALDELFERSSIDSETHERYEKILQIGHERERLQTRTRFGFATN